MNITPFTHTEEFLLRNGPAVQVRPICPADANALRALFHRLSPETIYLRILTYRRDLTQKEAECLTNVDYHKRMAFVATREEAERDFLIAVARYSVVSKNQPNMAEVGIVVEDRYQNQGLGLYLLRRLTLYAREQGIQAFVGTVSLQNARIMRFIQRSGLPIERKLDMGVWQIRIDLY